MTLRSSTRSSASQAAASYRPGPSCLQTDVRA